MAVLIAVVLIFDDDTDLYYETKNESFMSVEINTGILPEIIAERPRFLFRYDNKTMRYVDPMELDKKLVDDEVIRTLNMLTGKNLVTVMNTHMNSLLSLKVRTLLSKCIFKQTLPNSDIETAVCFMLENAISMDKSVEFIDSLMCFMVQAVGQDIAHTDAIYRSISENIECNIGIILCKRNTLGGLCPPTPP